MKPLIVWTLGPVSDTGLQILRYSVNSVKKIYPKCDYLIRYNQLNSKQKAYIDTLSVETIEQTNYNIFNKSPALGYQVHWKLYPPRLELNRHEIHLDNDVVLIDRIQEIDNFLLDDAILTCQGLYGLYGMYSSWVKDGGIHINSGIYGLPPYYDLTEKVRVLMEQDKRAWSNIYDEQGLLAYLFLQYKKYYIIPLTSMPIVENDEAIDIYVKNPSCKGFHFVHSNTSHKHTGWQQFINRL
jgi:hypothetical protein